MSQPAPIERKHSPLLQPTRDQQNFIGSARENDQWGRRQSMVVRDRKDVSGIFFFPSWGVFWGTQSTTASPHQASSRLVYTFSDRFRDECLYLERHERLLNSTQEMQDCPPWEMDPPMRCHAMQYTLFLLHTGLLRPDSIHETTVDGRRSKADSRQQEDS